MKIVNFRVDDAEHALMHAIAKSEGLSLTAYIRRHFMVLGRELGLGEDPLAKLRPVQSEPSKPQVIRRPIPQGVNAWRDEIYVRMNSGESAADVAESYGVSAQLVKDKYKAAKDDKQYHIDAGLPVPPLAAPSEYTPPADTPPDDEPELVYDPVDPDNPTEEEQAAHAEIARRRMIALGFKL